MAVKEKSQHLDDEAHLHRLGYAQVLYREMGGFSNFAISFTIISILAGCLTSYYLAFNNGGPVAITWGWLLVGAFCVLVSMAMGEIASAMPTAGALYFWASKLGGPAWGWFTGWFNLIGEIAVTAAIQYGSAIFMTALLDLWTGGAIGNGTGTIFIVFTLIAGLQLWLSMLNINVLSLLNTISAWWHMAGVAVIVVVLIVVPENHQSAGFVFGETINNSGFSDTAFWFVFGLGLLMSQYTITGYDASAHMSEETRQASRTAALGMVMAVVASVVFGFVLLVAVTFAVPDVPGVLDAGGDAVIYIWTESLGETWTEFLLVIAVAAQLFCGTASVTASSRMLFAFSRDGAVPFSQVWRKVAANRAPVNAVIAISVLAWALMLPTLVNGVLGYAVGTSIAVIGLYIAFGLPIILRIRAGSRFEAGAWSLGERYKWISTIAVGWIAVVCVLFLMPLSPAGVPGSEDFSWEAVNYAPITVFGALILFGGWYLLSARKWFTGPVREGGSLAELQSIEDQLLVAAGGTAAPSTTVAGTATDTDSDTKADDTKADDTKADDKAETDKADTDKAAEVDADKTDVDKADSTTDADKADADKAEDAAEPADKAKTDDADGKEADSTEADDTAGVGAGTGDPARADGEARAEVSPEARAALKEELKAELMTELKAELLAELKPEPATNGRAKRTTTRTTASKTTESKTPASKTTASKPAASKTTASKPAAGKTTTSRTTKSSSRTSTKADTTAGTTANGRPEPDAEPEAETPAN